MIVAEGPILETQIVPPPPQTDFGEYLGAIAEVHGWQAAKTSYGYQIKSPDLAVPLIFPKSSISEARATEIKAEGWGITTGSDFAILRAPQGAFVPPIRLPITTIYRVHVSQIDNRKLSDLGISVQVLADLQTTNFQALSVMTFGQFLESTAEGTGRGLALGVPIQMDKLSETLNNEWKVQIEGNDVEPVLWEERQTKNVFLESRNVDDSRVAVDREEINGGKKIEIEPVGNGFYRVTLEDLSIFGDDVTGLSSTGVVDLRGRKATWIYQGKQVTKRKGLFRKGHSIQSVSYIVTCQVHQLLPGAGVAEPVLEEIRPMIRNPAGQLLNDPVIRAPGRHRPFVTSPLHKGLQRKP